MRTIMPWEMIRDEFVDYRQTLPRPRHASLVYAKNGSEEELHNATIKRRRDEITPPDFTDYAIGTWMLADDSLYQLRELPIMELLLSEGPNRITVEKYMNWYRNLKSDFPPVRVVETNGFHYRLSDGHHRLQAMKNLGFSSVKAWVNVSFYERLDVIGIDKLYARDCNYPELVLMAMRTHQHVPTTVLCDAMSQYKSAIRIISLSSTRYMDGHESRYVTPTTIETLRKWQIISAPFNSTIRMYLVEMTAFGKQIAELIQEEEDYAIF